MSKDKGRADVFRVGADVTMESQSYLVEVHITRFMARKHILICCAAFANDRTDVDDRQKIRRTVTHTLSGRQRIMYRGHYPGRQKQ
jgi:hypothetical protein